MNPKKILSLLLCIVGIVLLVLGLRMAYKNSYIKDEPTAGNSEVNVQILNELNIDKYLGIVFEQSIDLNKNLLDKEYSKFNYYFSNIDDVEKINIQIQSNPEDRFVFTKYGNYIDAYEKLLGPKKSENLSRVGYKFTDLVEISPGIFYTNGVDDGEECKRNDENCFVVLYKDSYNTNEVTLDDLKESNNTITGSVKLLTTIENKEYELNGKFEFKYVEENNKKYASSLIITSVDDGYTEVIK